MFIIYKYIHTFSVTSGLSSCGLSSTMCSRYSHKDSNVSLHACSNSFSVLKGEQNKRNKHNYNSIMTKHYYWLLEEKYFFRRHDCFMLERCSRRSNPFRFCSSEQFSNGNRPVKRRQYLRLSNALAANSFSDTKTRNNLEYMIKNSYIIRHFLHQ
jgi:hypothetical protein